MQVQSLSWEDPLEKGLTTPLQYSCLENPTGRRTWWAMAMRLQNQTQLKLLSNTDFQRRVNYKTGEHKFSSLHTAWMKAKDPDFTRKECSINENLDLTLLQEKFVSVFFPRVKDILFSKPSIPQCFLFSLHQITHLFHYQWLQQS